MSKLARTIPVALVTLALTFAPSAAPGATSTVGQTFAPDPASNCGSGGGTSFLQTEVSSGNLYIVPTSGVITSWAFQTGSDLPSALKLKVGRPQEDGSLLFVGEAAAGALTPNAVNSYPASVTVDAGDIIGFFMAGSGDCSIFTADPNDAFVSFLGDPAVGSAPTPFNPNGTGARFPVSATMGTTGPEAPAATCKGKPATIVGTDGNDVRKGTTGQDVIVGLGGNDRLSGLGGNDLICGGSGNDNLSGGKGNDKLYGQKGKDKLRGKAGKDLCVGGPGKDTAKGCEKTKSI